MAGEVCRRTLLRGAVLTAGGAALSACGGDGAPAAGTGAPASSSPSASAPAAPPASGSAAPSATPSAASSGPALAALADVPVGSALPVGSADGPVLLVRTSETAVAGFSAVCPHQGCTVAPADGGLVCPCHASSFELTTGRVLQGPATRDLSPYPVAVVDGSIVPA